MHLFVHISRKYAGMRNIPPTPHFWCIVFALFFGYTIEQQKMLLALFSRKSIEIGDVREWKAHENSIFTTKNGHV